MIFNIWFVTSMVIFSFNMSIKKYDILNNNKYNMKRKKIFINSYFYLLDVCIISIFRNKFD